MRITRPCLIIRDFGTHTTPRVLHFSALVILVLLVLKEQEEIVIHFTSIYAYVLIVQGQGGMASKIDVRSFSAALGSHMEV